MYQESGLTENIAEKSIPEHDRSITSPEQLQQTGYVLIQETTEQEFQQQDNFIVRSIHQETKTLTPADVTKTLKIFDSRGTSVKQDKELPVVVLQKDEVPTMGEQKDVIQVVLMQEGEVPVVDGKSSVIFNSHNPSLQLEGKMLSTMVQEKEVPEVMVQKYELSTVEIQKEVPSTLMEKNDVTIILEAPNDSTVNPDAEKAGRREKMSTDQLEAGEKLVSSAVIDSIVKLSRLCYTLDTNVKNLKLFYGNGGYSYSKAEHTILKSGIRSLVEDMPKLMKKLNKVDGQRVKIEKMFMYHSYYESRYRELKRICLMRVKSPKKTA